MATLDAKERATWLLEKNARNTDLVNQGRQGSVPCIAAVSEISGQPTSAPEVRSFAVSASFL